jgi:hypothetical protein
MGSGKMAVQIKEVKSKKELKEFIHLPARIHRDHSRWVPPLYSEEWKYFSAQKNHAFSYSDTVLALAYSDEEAVGRIMGIINTRYNMHKQERSVRFGYLECENDQDAAHALLSHVERWGEARGMRKIVGPMGFSDQDPEGFLIQGFEHEPTLATYCNFAYMIRLLESEGYSKEVDYVVYRIDIPDQVPELYEKIYSRMMRKGNFQLKEFSRKKHLKSYIRPVFALMNECFKDIYGYFPLDQKEIDEMGRKYLPIAFPRFIKLVERDNQVVGFIIGIPNLSPGFRRARGRLFPFGLFKILRWAKKTKQLDLLLGGIKEEFRGRGLDVMLGLKMLQEARKAGFVCIDSHHQLEDKTRMRAEMERLGGRVYKRFRIFQKDLFSVTETD